MAVVYIVNYLDCVFIIFLTLSCRLSTNGTLLSLVWWPTLGSLWSIRRNCWTCWSNARTRYRLGSRLDSIPKCPVDSLQSSFTLPRSWADWACCPWVTCSSHSQTCDGPSRQMLESPISCRACPTMRTSSFPTCTGKPKWCSIEIWKQSKSRNRMVKIICVTYTIERVRTAIFLFFR